MSQHRWIFLAFHYLNPFEAPVLFPLSPDG